MEYSESVLIDLYTWCFGFPPDTITGNSVSSASGTNSVSVYQNEMPDTSMVWCVSVQSEFTKITSFEVDMASCIEIFKQAWTNKDSTLPDE